ncbi:MAG: hypothetical protein J0I06_27375 [Planctomycetes bacterium]|nr:hypothetical protein [Planctomycetota bacterium]
MRRVVLRAAVLGLWLGLVALSVPRADADETPTKAPDWTGYVYVTDVVGEVVKADDKKIVLRITWLEAQVKNGNRNTRPNLNANHRHFHNPYSGNRPNVQIKQQHHDYELEYMPQSLVRAKSLPPKIDENGKKASYTQKEYDALRAPSGVTGYAANRSDLTPGTIVEVILIRDKTVPAAKATEDDLRIKYAIIQGKDPNPPKDIASGSNPNPNPKKKN